ncbi:hypothetical protein JG688_00009364 [Phytophthora aleatoria]|uniref:Elicitin n=1 Tax=Phytophthora aleatoria TaxID=2496075 RepID=A0A8J5MFG1_9STRA|nr:hypothetical protein JG688_00009364 [Phytophthora aleatoria]
MRLPASVFLQLLALLSSVTDAVECTDSEAAYAGTLWDDAGTTSACAQYVVATNPVYIDAPCTATDCVGVMEGVAENLPSCTFSGVSNKIELQNALTVCNGGDTEDAGSPTAVTDAPITSSSTTPTPTSSSATDCTTEEYTSTEDLYDAAAATSACSPYSTSSSVLVSFDTPCSATDCINVLVQLAADLPDCLYDGANQKTELTDNLGFCTDTATEVDSSTPASTSGTTSSSPTPASTASSTGCTTTEVKDMWDLYVSTVTSDKCASESTVNGYSIFIFTSCDSECADKVKDLAEALPNCYYEYEFMNKKQDVLAELDDCEESSSYHISVTIIPDSSIEFASSFGFKQVTMLSLHKSILLALAVSSTWQDNPVNAAECTDAEWSCVAVMEQVGEQLPDCTVSGVNNKIEVQNAMTAYNREDLIETDAPFVTPPTTAPLITIAPIVTSTPLSSLTPRPGGDASGVSETATATTAPSSTDGSVSNLESLYTRAAKSSSCAPDVTISSYSVYIYTRCASSCASKLEMLAGDIPNCYYDYGSSNMKASLLEKIDDCTGTNHANYISTTLYLSTTSATPDASSDFALHLGQTFGLVAFAVALALL